MTPTDLAAAAALDLFTQTDRDVLLTIALLTTAVTFGLLLGTALYLTLRLSALTRLATETRTLVVGLTVASTAIATALTRATDLHADQMPFATRLRAHDLPIPDASAIAQPPSGFGGAQAPTGLLNITSLAGAAEHRAGAGEHRAFLKGRRV